MRYLLLVVSAVIFSACIEPDALPDNSPAVQAYTALNDTGSVSCGDYAYSDTGTAYDVSGSATHNNDIDCALAGVTQSNDAVEAANGADIIRAGQDAVFGRDVTHNDHSDGHRGFSFTKLDNTGIALVDQNSSYLIQPWRCVQDNVTGLIWEVKTDDGALQDKDHKYSWYNSTGVNDGGDVGLADGGSCSGLSSCDTEQYVEAMNAAAVCGITQWRLPVLDELINIVSSDRTATAIDTDYFPHTMYLSGGYLTSQSYNGEVNRAWNVYFSNGMATHNAKSDANVVRLVYGDKPATGEGCSINRNANSESYHPTTRYTVHGDGTVTDTHTGLMWQACSLGYSGADCQSGSIARVSWQAALAMANENSDYNYTDWRLPNKNELASLADQSCYRPAINNQVFPNSIINGYWSSTPYAHSAVYRQAWRVDFATGASGPIEKNSPLFVRLVRDSQ